MQWLALAILFILSGISIAETSPKIRVKEGPPPGFEDLVRPQLIDVDVYYGGLKIGNTLAKFTPSTIEFTQPFELTSMIPFLISQEIVAGALTGVLETNSDEICSSAHEKDCGIINPDIAGVIFDENSFRVSVFVNQLQLEPQAITSNKYLPKIINPEFSTVTNFSTRISGEDGDTSYTTGANHIFSYGQSRVQSNWDYSDTQDFGLNTFSAQDDREGIAKEMGYFNTDTQFSAFTRDLDIAGGRIYSSTNMRTDLDYAQATEIFLFLNSRSRVEVFKDDKLLDGGFYDAGNQQLNTLRLPGGSYPINLRITDSAGNVKEEQYFFVKSARLPPKDQPLHYLEVGMLEEDNSDSTLPEFSDSELLRLGTAYRLTNSFGTSLEFLHTADNNLLQTGATYFGAGYFFQNSIMLGTDSEWGLQLLGQYQSDQLSFNLDYRQVNSDDDYDSDVQILPSEFNQGTFSSSLPLGKGQLSLRAQYRNTPNEDSTKSYGFDYRYPLLRRNRYTVELNLSSSINDDDYNFLTGFRISKNNAAQQINLRPSYSVQETDGDSEQGLLLTADINQTYEDPNYGRFTFGSFLSEEFDRSTIGVRGNNASSFGNGDALFEWVDDTDRGEFMRYQGGQDTSLLSTSDKFAFGGERNANSGILINIIGEPKNEPFEIFVDGQPRGFAKVGKSTVLALNAFETYQISIRSRSDELLDFDVGQTPVTLYPGNVQKVTYEVNPIVVLISRIMLDDGSPASRMRVTNAVGYAVTDEDGWLQAEISGELPLQLSKNGNHECTIDLPVLKIESGVAFVDELRCKK